MIMQRLVNGSWVDCTKADLIHHDQYRISVNGGYQQMQYIELSEGDSERIWRDKELKETDWIVPVTDHPQHADYLIYREALRDYPEQVDFPNGTRPTL